MISHVSPKEPGWRKGERFIRVGSFALEASPERIFRLLCPVREYDWLPGWSCTMVYSESGVAEPNAIFLTRHPFSPRLVWTLITYEPPRLVEYLVVSGVDLVMRLSIALAEAEGGATSVRWEMLFTTATRKGALATAREFSAERYEAMMHERKRQLQSYLSREEVAQP